MIVANTLVSNFIEHRLRIVVGKGFVTTEIVHESVGANSSANAREQCFHPSSVFLLVSARGEMLGGKDVGWKAKQVNIPVLGRKMLMVTSH